MSLKFIETSKKEMYHIENISGQLIYCTDTNETFFDNEELSRLELNNVIYLDKESDRNNLLKPLMNRVYVVKATGIPYKYEGTWYKIKDVDRLLCTLYHNDEYIPTTIMKKENKIAPRTLASVVYNDNGNTVYSEIEAVNKLTLCKTKYVYVEATEDGQKVFNIPYPISDYDFRKNFMTVIINNIVYEETRFTIRDDNYLVLNDDETGLDSGQLVLFVFYYNVYIDINDGVLLTTKNLRDRCVTEPKLDNNSVSTRTIISKAVNNNKLGDNSVDDRVLDKDNISLSPSNIEETTDKKFVSSTQIAEWDATKEIAESNELAIVEINKKIDQAPKILVSATEPAESKNDDIWVDTANFIFKIRKNNQWIAMGAVYN